MIILIGGEKGGTGKTTIATNLAAIRVKKEHDVLLIDTDMQKSASAWANTRDIITPSLRITNIQKYGLNLAKDILSLKNRYEDIIIDAGGADNVELRAAMTIADKMYSPIQASQPDVWTLGKMNENTATAKGFNPALIAKILINRASTNPQIKEVEEAQAAIEDLEHLSLSNCILKERVAYRKAAKIGASVVELPELDLKAFDEIMALYNEVFNGNN